MAVRIESEDNSKLKLIRKLSSKKHRDAEGKFVIEGINLVEEAIRRNVPLDMIIISEDFEADVSRMIPDEGVYLVSRTVFEKISDAENGSGVLAVARKSISTENDLSELDADTNILVLDRVQDPGNIGTMIRTAVAAGYGALLVNKGTADIFSPKVLRATAGMVFDIPIAYADGAGDTASILKRLGKKVCVTVPRGGRAYYDADLSKGVALVIGNEGNGISDELIDLADEKLTIPMCGEIESLNAAISAAILMYEAVRGRREL
mgnify:FL=1